MSYISDYQKQLKAAINPSELGKLVGDLIILNGNIIILDVRKRWEQGLGVNGGIIGTYRWEEYRQYKQALNPSAGGNVDLTLTGALAEGLTIRKQSGGYQIYSTDSKYEKLGKKYGFEEFGVTEEQLHEFFEDMYSVAMESILSKLWA